MTITTNSRGRSHSRLKVDQTGGEQGEKLNMFYLVWCLQNSVYSSDLVDKRYIHIQGILWWPSGLREIRGGRKRINIIEILHPTCQGRHDALTARVYILSCSELAALGLPWQQVFELSPIGEPVAGSIIAGFRQIGREFSRFF